MLTVRSAKGEGIGSSWLDPLQISLYSIGAEVLTVRPTNSNKKDAHLPEIGIILKSLEEIAPHTRRNIEYAG
ncbi:hypothetical protein [Citrifermentans bemidjiense]|uniref:hypothetical protein n=1 Tax=Citrifermentans bemidjiense TaxID=225194 RepID=UPI00017BFBDF|nr:hypothetical protein [Citrifermentans bemidjiense]